MVLAALAECMATRYITPDDDLWRHATTAFSAIVNAGLPAVNIAYVNHQYPPENTWQAVAAAFEMFLLAEHIPKHLPQQQQPLQQTYSSSSEGQPPKVSMSHARSKSETSSTLVAAVNDLHKQQGQHSKQAGGESDNELQVCVVRNNAHTHRLFCRSRLGGTSSLHYIHVQLVEVCHHQVACSTITAVCSIISYAVCLLCSFCTTCLACSTACRPWSLRL